VMRAVGTALSGPPPPVPNEAPALVEEDHVRRALWQLERQVQRVRQAEIVATDEREAGPRRILNFGHTAGHALESVTKYRRYRHGEAVAYGMLVAAELARGRGALAETDRQALADVIASLGPLPPIADLSTSHILEAMKHDKKMVAGRLHFVLPTTVGATTIVDDVTEKEMRAALKQVGFKT